jgi:uncharacterized protein (DUF58 family)
MMLVAPVLSAVINFTLRKRMTIEIHDGVGANKTADIRNSEKYIKQGDEFFVTVKVNNPTPFPCLDAVLRLEITNTFFENGGEKGITIPIRAAGGFTFTLPLVSDYPGIIRVAVKDIRLKDLMGFFWLKKEGETQLEVTVLPELIGELETDKVNFNQGMLESEESSKRGNDFSDVQEIREYIPGDKLMSIHWKLSAKRDILMVKDRVSMSDRQMVVLPELANKNMADLNGVLAATYTLITQLIADKTTVRLMYWSVNRYEYEDIRIDYREELDAAFARMFYERTYEAYDEAASHMADVHPEMKAYLHVYSTDGTPHLNICENA